MNARLRPIAIILGAALAVTTIAFAGCRSMRETETRDPEKIAQVTQPLIDTDGGPQQIAIGGTTPSAVTSPGAPAVPGQVITVGFPTVHHGPGAFSWTFSVGGGAYAAICNATTMGSCGTVDSSQGTWLGKPALAADGLRNIVYVSLVDTDMNFLTAERVVAIVSNDDGRTFSSAAMMVNNTTGDCAAGAQDYPHAAIDSSTSPPTLWVTWKNIDPLLPPGICVRGGTINTSGMGPPIFWTLPGASAVRLSNLISDHGIGAPMIQAGRQSVSVVYSTADNPPDCPSSTTFTQGWASTTSFDNGANWNPTIGSPGMEAQKLIVRSTNAIGCAGDPATMDATLRMQLGQRQFSYFRSPDGDDWLAIATDKNRIRLYHSASQGWAWREDCANGYSPSQTPCLTPALGTWTSAFHPVVLMDANNRMTVSLYATDGTDLIPRVELWGHVAPRFHGVSFWQPLAPPLQNPFAMANNTDPLQFPKLGWYASGTVLPGPGCSSEAGVLPGGDKNDGIFYPVWTAGPDQRTIFGRYVILAP